MNDKSAGRHSGSGRYDIRIEGHLDSRWATWFDGLSVINESGDTTVISGPVIDQAALHGLLQKLRDLDLPLISVTRVEPNSPAAFPSAPR